MSRPSASGGRRFADLGSCDPARASSTSASTTPSTSATMPAQRSASGTTIAATMLIAENTSAARGRTKSRSPAMIHSSRPNQPDLEWRRSAPRLLARVAKQQMSRPVALVTVLHRIFEQSLVAEFRQPLPQCGNVIATRIQHRAALAARVDVDVVDEIVGARHVAGRPAVARDDLHLAVERRADRGPKAPMRTLDQRPTNGLLGVAEAALGQRVESVVLDPRLANADLEPQ